MASTKVGYQTIVFTRSRNHVTMKATAPQEFYKSPREMAEDIISENMSEECGGHVHFQFDDDKVCNKRGLETKKLLADEFYSKTLDHFYSFEATWINDGTWVSRYHYEGQQPSFCQGVVFVASKTTCKHDVLVTHPRKYVDPEDILELATQMVRVHLENPAFAFSNEDIQNEDNKVTRWSIQAGLRKAMPNHYVLIDTILFWDREHNGPSELVTSE